MLHRGFNKINGLILGRPYDNKYVQEYNEILLQVIRDEEGRDDLTIVTEMNFGHTCPCIYNSLRCNGRN